MAQSEFKEYIHINLAMVLPHVEQNDDLVQNKKMLPNGLVFYYMYLSEMNDEDKIKEAIETLLHEEDALTLETVTKRLDKIDARPVFTAKEAVISILRGKCAMFINGLDHVYILSTGKREKRSVTEPTSEKVVRGPKIAFIEDSDTNVAMIRQRTNHPKLKTKKVPIGENKLKYATVMYIDDEADPSVVNDVLKRLSKVKMDDIQDSGTLEELIEDNKYSPFPQIQNTERPDKVSSALFNGRVAILVDNSPFALVVPASLGILMQSPDDYYERWISASLIRALRFTSIFITLFFSSIYIALVSFHQGLLPTSLAVTIAANRENVPFPPIIEAMVMEMTIELLREAGLRLPSPLGQTIGLVGGVVIGQAAVEAKLVSSIMVIVVSIVALASFTVPQYGMGLSFRVLRFISMFTAAAFGLYGMILFMLAIYTHLSRQRSFGSPYFSPNGFFSLKNANDSILRLPIKNQPKEAKNVNEPENNSQ
ncbi:spore germination protein [Bacillus amyloliquefaciens]|uniref:Spore germination protein A1 n=1 Tax=Bacillus amyloliquefaciens (strain ATCC 23350 / DSM 7 / BCRC 11601 / CCUG 28519 / NBRC 15535 / NRRL B-14393 / F) TaxID=692420 RepID=A0A9P1NIW2_BACAS|nr:spore germination protein [Bacillus amyloliquefaciens]AZV90639.1 spore germination protein [Bacillus amyloliquefaciens]MDR4376449.1 spore germination protein [Bacillus amyloliquefaciens]MEC1841027.1 spore germination protein [Bacillus amyloliquefaciens]MEC1848508.1 spore germination protein [Bacillus amyloliquefaciens]MEC1927904.1 spore germination protein [Bacillus amyloliquefaciens]